MAYSTFLIDLDETLYATSCGVWEAITERINCYMHERLKLPLDEVSALRKELFLKYGTTLRGLQVTQTVDMRDFLDYVHDVPITQLLSPDPELRATLLHYSQRKIIFTNADHWHAGRVLRQLGIEDLFEKTIDIYDINPHCKPMREAFQIALDLCGSPPPDECVFIDDSPRNLAAARAMGFFTIQVGPAGPDAKNNVVSSHVQISRFTDLPSVLPPTENGQS
jgi:putative hydrolase of the HAD superfamily